MYVAIKTTFEFCQYTYVGIFVKHFQGHMKDSGHKALSYVRTTLQG